MKMSNYVMEMDKQFSNYPKAKWIVKEFFKNAISVRNGKLYVNDIPIPIRCVAGFLEVDRRTVKKIVRDIESNPELQRVFSRLRHDGPSLTEIGRLMQLDVIEIAARPESSPKIVARVAEFLSKRGVLMRAVYTQHFEFDSSPTLVVVTADDIPASVLKKLATIKGVESVRLYAPETATEGEKP